MKILAIAALLVSLLVLPGCIYVPPVWDIGDAINNVDWIKPGVTTKEQVVKRLGEPDGIAGDLIFYQGNWSDGYIFWGSVCCVAGAGLIEEESWSIDIEFDAAGVVRKLTKSGVEKRRHIHSP